MPTSDFSQFPIDPSRGPSAPHVERDRLTGEITNLPEKVREPAVFNSKAFKPTDAQVELMRGDLIKAGIDPAKVDEALRRDGFTIKPQIDPVIAREHEQANVPLEPAASAYVPDWRSSVSLQNISGAFKNLDGVNAASSE